MKKLLLVCSILLFHIVCNKPTFSQVISPIKTLTVNKVTGKIITINKSALRSSGIKIELRETNTSGETISSYLTTTDESGFFEFNGIKKGKYLLNVYFIIKENLIQKYRAIVNMNKSGSSKSKPSILIRFTDNIYETEAATVN